MKSLIALALLGVLVASARPAHAGREDFEVLDAVASKNNGATPGTEQFNCRLASAAVPIPVTVTPSGTQDVNLTKVGGAAVALGQAAMAASLPVTLASNQGNITTDKPSFATLTTSTAACAGSATLLLAANAAAVATRFCNEGTVDVRIGGSGISSTIGAIVFARTCLGLDDPRYFRGALYCASTGATQAVSATQGTP